MVGQLQSISLTLPQSFPNHLCFDFPLLLKTSGYVEIYSDVHIAARRPAQASKNYAVDRILLLELAHFKRAKLSNGSVLRRIGKPG